MEYRNQESHATADANLIVKIGVVEAGRLDALVPECAAHDEVGVTVKQILVSTTVNPWVYLMLYWGTEAEFNNSTWAKTYTR